MKLQERSKIAQNEIAQDLLKLMEIKSSNLALALDIPNRRRFLEVLERTGEYIVVLKTHIDIIQEFDFKFVERLMTLKEKYKFLIFEDRKFADIGNTVKLQYTQGIYRIIEWADLVNAHIFPGAGVIEGLREAWLESKYKRGLILLPQMTSRDNLFDEQTMVRGIQWAREYCDFVIGFIGAASLKPTSTYNLGEDDDWGTDQQLAAVGPPILGPQDKEEYQEIMGEELKKEDKITIEEASLSALRQNTWPEFIIFTPGVKLEQKGDKLGQTYVTPRVAVEQGSDIIIVGRGIYEAEQPGKVAAEYRQRGWEVFRQKKEII